MNTQTSKQFIRNHDDTMVYDEQEQFCTVQQFCPPGKWPTESAMRSYIYKAEELGISDAFIRVGRRVLISPKKFWALIKQIGDQPKK